MPTAASPDSPLIREAATCSEEDVKKKASSQSTIISGWRLSLIFGAVGSLIVLIINLAVTIWSIPKSDGDMENSKNRRILYEGSCSRVRKWNTALHLLINVLSSILLAASNFSMQCLSAPTRADVDKAHARWQWLDIGVPSVQNLFRIPRKRTVLWCLLLLSSVPLHLLYNSVIFPSLSVQDYKIYWVEESPDYSTFDRSFAEIEKIGDSLETVSVFEEPIETLWEQARSNQLRNLTTRQCIKAYGTAFQTSWRHVLLVTKPGLDSNMYGIPRGPMHSVYDSSISGTCPPNMYDWICAPIMSNECKSDGTCHGFLPKILNEADTWDPFETGLAVKYCLSEPAEQLCRLNFSIVLMSFVIVANALKAAILAYTAFCPLEEPLLVLGDAIRSFLAAPELSSTDSCLTSAADVKRAGKGSWTGPRLWLRTKRRWGAVVSRRRWIASVAFYLSSLLTLTFFLVWGIKAMSGPHDFRSIWSVGFGKVSELALITFNNSYEDEDVGKQIIQSALSSNLPQVFFSVLYFHYNGVFTAMLAAKEWGDFGVRRRSLRVSSDPSGQQRSTYFLQLPYRWSIPLLAMSILIHWMLSQSIFLVAVEQSEWNLIEINCGYSPVAIICVILASLVLVVAVVVTGCLYLPTSIPVVGSCSLAIAAACHHHEGIPQPEASLAALRWGVMKRHDHEGDENGIGHCGFSAEYVEEPQEGVQYS